MTLIRRVRPTLSRAITVGVATTAMGVTGGEGPGSTVNTQGQAGVPAREQGGVADGKSPRGNIRAQGFWPSPPYRILAAGGQVIRPHLEESGAQGTPSEPGVSRYQVRNSGYSDLAGFSLKLGSLGAESGGRGSEGPD